MYALIGYDGFDWDEGNAGKNWSKHGVADFECEEVFFNRPLIVRRDVGHSQGEDRWVALGRTAVDRKLFIVFTMRQKSLRVISARDMTRREGKAYDDHERHEKAEDYSGI
ncbi:MAG: BrnT family toxin [Terriglobia bacterium]